MVQPRNTLHTATKAVRYLLGYAKAALFLQIFATRHGAHALFTDRRPIMINRGVIYIGRRFRTRCRMQRAMFETGPNGTLRIGDDVFINQGTCIYAEQSVTIGNRVDIGDAVRIYDTNFHPTAPGGTTRVAPVEIEDDVWIASGAVILPGVTVGRGSVIAAGAIVTKSVPPGSVVASRPAEIISKFDVPANFRRRVLDQTG